MTVRAATRGVLQANELNQEQGEARKCRRIRSGNTGRSRGAMDSRQPPNCSGDPKNRRSGTNRREVRDQRRWVLHRPRSKRVAAWIVRQQDNAYKHRHGYISARSFVDTIKLSNQLVEASAKSAQYANAPGRAGTSTSGASRRCGDIDILDRRGLSMARTRIWGPDVFRFDQRLAEVERSRTESNANNHRAAKHRAEGNLARLDNVVADRPG
jgi:hypothetical protein